MDDNLSGRAALVIGGSRGIGAAVALRLAGGGADVALTYLADAEAAKAVAARIADGGRRALVLQADTADAAAMDAAVQRAADEFGRLDVLVNNAAEFRVGPLAELDLAAVDRLIAANVRGPFLAARAAAQRMGKGGRIITIGSNVVGRTPSAGFTLYSMSKTALVGMTKGLSRDLGPREITANLVNPGPTDTSANPADGPLAGTFAGFTALGRYGMPDEIADVVGYLAGPGSGYVTGAVVDVDGGFSV